MSKWVRKPSGGEAFPRLEFRVRHSSFSAGEEPTFPRHIRRRRIIAERGRGAASAWSGVSVERRQRGVLSAVEPPPPAAHPGPQAAGRVADAEAPQRLPDARQHAALRGGGPAQLLPGGVVDPPQLLAVVFPQVAQLLGRRLREDGGAGRRAGGRGGAPAAPRPLRGGGFAFGARFDGTRRRSTTGAVIHNVYDLNVDLDPTAGRDEAPPLFQLLPGPVPLLFAYFLSGGWRTAVVHDNVVKGHITPVLLLILLLFLLLLLLFLVGRCVLQACDSLASVDSRRNIPEHE
ncbi:hypothetical protein EYF80_044479 [Liparis tanakae]|uniref:Uncharacterized protein n=1 Tax=Liparis tanakae TaxID=230148 RepID=A0A4Z2FVQ8_9TELE|nr:hypothetical protein EYF80_044479 [Liparis tanakae]